MSIFQDKQIKDVKMIEGNLNFYNLKENRSEEELQFKDSKYSPHKNELETQTQQKPNSKKDDLNNIFTGKNTIKKSQSEHYNELPYKDNKIPLKVFTNTQKQNEYPKLEPLDLTNKPQQENFERIESKLSALSLQMKLLSEKQINLIDAVRNLESSSKREIALINNKINNLERKTMSLIDNDNNYSTKEKTLENNLKFVLSSNNDDNIADFVFKLSLLNIQQLSVNIIEDTLLCICSLILKGKYVHQCINFIKCVMVYSKEKKLTKNSIKNIKDVLDYLSTQNNLNLNDEDKIDISLLILYVNKK